MSYTLVREKREGKKDTMTYAERKRQIEKEKANEERYQFNKNKSPFTSFIQLNKEFYEAEDWLLAESNFAYRIFKFLIQNMDKYNAVVCSQNVLMENFECSRQSITRAVKVLRDNQFIEVHKSGVSNIYSVNKRIVWSSWGKNYRYAKFGANIIISESEQKGCRKEIQIDKYNKEK